MTPSLLAALLSLNALTLHGPQGHAKEASATGCRVVLDVGVREAAALDEAGLVDALAEASGCDVERGARGATVLRVRLIGARARLTLRASGRATLVRVVSLDDDPYERTRAMVIVATHMLRNEADELLGLLGARDESGGAVGAPTVAPDTTPAIDPEPAIEQAPAIDPEPAIDQAPANDPAPAIDPAPAVVPEATSVSTREPTSEVATSSSSADVGPAEPAPASEGPRMVRLGLGGLVSTLPAGSGREVTAIAGLEISVAPTPWLAFGARDLSGGVPRGTTWMAGGGLFVELSLRALAWLALEAQLGADVRAIGLGDRQIAGVAPFVVLGARASALPELSFALQSGLHVAASDLWTTSGHLVPRAAVVWSGGLAVAVHL